MPLLVEDRHDHGDGGERGTSGFGVHQAAHVTANGGHRRAPPGAVAGPQIVWAYGAHDPTYGRRPRRCPPCPRPPPPPRPPRRPAPAARAGPPGRPPRRQQPRWGMRVGDHARPCVVLAAGGIGHAVVTGLDAGIDRVDPFNGHEEPARRPGTA